MTEYNGDGDSPVVDDAEEELLEGAEDDLDDNPFYRVFSTHFRTEYNVLQEYGGILCVPHSALLYNVRITQPLVGLFLPTNPTHPHPLLERPLTFDNKHNGKKCNQHPPQRTTCWCRRRCTWASSSR